MGMIRDGVAKHGGAWFTSEQTQGKGRRGKTWQSETGKNIALSIAVKAGILTLYQQFQLTVAAALACHNFFKKYAGDRTEIKWPNDILWNDRKAGGILIENVLKGTEWQWAVIGIGLNINQTRFDISSVFTPVSLKQITGKEYDIVDLAKQLHVEVMESYDTLQNNGFEKMLEEYNRNLYGMDRKVKLKKGNVVFETTVKGVTAGGELITMDTMERKFNFDEVEWGG